jgi:hypothetical protein
LVAPFVCAERAKSWAHKGEVLANHNFAGVMLFRQRDNIR